MAHRTPASIFVSSGVDFDEDSDSELPPDLLTESEESDGEAIDVETLDSKSSDEESDIDFGKLNRTVHIAADDSDDEDYEPPAKMKRVGTLVFLF